MTVVIDDMSRIHIRNSQIFYSTILKSSFVLFLLTNVALFCFLYERNEPEPECLEKGTCRIMKKPRKLPREQWGQTLYFKVLVENFRLVNKEWRLVPRFNSTDLSAELSCSSMKDITDMKFIAAGWTKSTYRVKYNNSTISMKTVNIDGHDIKSCMQEEDRYLYDCFLIAASKLLREISVLRTISHPNIVKILGYCIPADPDVENPLRTVAIFEEFGEPIDVIKMLQLSWEDRLRISLGLSRLVKHLASFEEPIALNDFRRQQFVVIDGEPKLIDVDDVGLEEPKCNNTPCCFPLSSDKNREACVYCVDNVCRGYNEKINIIRTGGHFIKHILPYGVPSKLNSVTMTITAAFEFAFWNAGKISEEMEKLLLSFKNGWYRTHNNQSTGFLSGFRSYRKKDVSSDFDYRCQLTASGYGCMMSVLDSEEAAEICVSDVNCKAFVISDVTTWTGRRVALFKNGFGNFIDNNATTLFIRV